MILTPPPPPPPQNSTVKFDVHYLESYILPVRIVYGKSLDVAESLEGITQCLLPRTYRMTANTDGALLHKQTNKQANNNKQKRPTNLEPHGVGWMECNTNTGSLLREIHTRRSRLQMPSSSNHIHVGELKSEA